MEISGILDSLKKLKNLKKESIKKSKVPSEHHNFFARGKLLLSGEYFVLDGAKAFALPSKLGQRMSVRYTQSFSPLLHWKSFDVYGNLWFECKFEFWHFNFTDISSETQEQLFLQKLLREVRKQNNHFLRDGLDVHVETFLDFPLDWGLGSSSTLIYNLAQWGYVGAFELNSKTTNGSGYDVACAQLNTPLIYFLEDKAPSYLPVDYNRDFHQNLFFVHLNKKAKSDIAINSIAYKRPFSREQIQYADSLTDELMKIYKQEDFNKWIADHEKFVAKSLDLKTAKELCFNDFEGEIKSLGAWGGDFILASSLRDENYLKEYFINKGHSIILPYNELIYKSPSNIISPNHGSDLLN